MKRQERIEIGSSVVFSAEDDHVRKPWLYPEMGTIGKVVVITSCDYLVQWNDGMNAGHNFNWCRADQIMLYWDYVDKLTEEISGESALSIYKMLLPKLLRNNVNNIEEAVSVAYKAGYCRAIKGRPFIYNNFQNKE